MDERKMYLFTDDEIKVIEEALIKMPFEKVNKIIYKIRDQNKKINRNFQINPVYNPPIKNYKFTCDNNDFGKKGLESDRCYLRDEAWYRMHCFGAELKN